MFTDVETLNATVPAGLDPGSYSLYVLNPAGGAGVLPNAIYVTTDLLPVIPRGK